MCVSNKFLCDADAGDPKTTFRNGFSWLTDRETITG